jgi:hypothetical protein
MNQQPKAAGHFPPRGRDFFDLACKKKVDLHSVKTNFLARVGDVFHPSTPLHFKRDGDVFHPSTPLDFKRDGKFDFFKSCCVCWDLEPPDQNSKKDKIRSVVSFSSQSNNANNVTNNEVQSMFDEYFVGNLDGSTMKLSEFITEKYDKLQQQQQQQQQLAQQDSTYVLDLNPGNVQAKLDANKDIRNRMEYCFRAAITFADNFQIDPAIGCAYFAKVIFELTGTALNDIIVNNLIPAQIPGQSSNSSNNASSMNKLVSMIEASFKENCLDYANGLFVLLVKYNDRLEDLFDSGQTAFVTATLLSRLEKILDTIAMKTTNMTCDALNFHYKFARILAQCLFLTFDVDTFIGRDKLKNNDDFCIKYAGQKNNYQPGSDGLFIEKIKKIIVKCSRPITNVPKDVPKVLSPISPHHEMSLILSFVLFNVMKIGLFADSGFEFIWGSWEEEIYDSDTKEKVFSSF